MGETVAKACGLAAAEARRCPGETAGWHRSVAAVLLRAADEAQWRAVGLAGEMAGRSGSVWAGEVAGRSGSVHMKLSQQPSAGTGVHVDKG
jgi:hypothetical protein